MPHFVPTTEAMDDTRSTRSETAAITVHGLVKRFAKREVLRGLDWQVPMGRVVGLLGRNGAGKTTLLRCLVGLSPIDAGEISILGSALAEPGGEHLHRLGFVPQTFDLFPWMKVRAYLDFTAAFYPRWDATLVARLLDDWQLDPKQKIGKLSQGQRQKLAIVRAMAPDPDLLLLDEPVASLDPQARRAFMQELLALVQRPGKTVVFSTHITADLERAGADIALLKDGRIALESPLPALRQRIRRAVLTRDAGWMAIPPLVGTLHATARGTVLQLIVEAVDETTLTAFAAAQQARLAIEPMTLEDLFVELA